MSVYTVYIIKCITYFMVKKKLDITPDTTLFAKMGESGHSHSDAVNELIDNSIDAKKDVVDIDITLDENNFIVRDNGRGMSFSDAENAMKLAYSRKKPTELGKYGIGMKSAMMRFGDAFVLETKKAGKKKKVVIKFDKSLFEENSSQWTIDCEEVACDESEHEKSFTELRTVALRNKLTKVSIGHIRANISKKFKTFLQGDEVNIVFNGEEVAPPKIMLVKDTKERFNILMNNGKRIHGWTGILRVPTEVDSGFNIYRNNRLIVGNEKITTRSNLITGEIHADCLNVASTKREFIKDSLYEEFLQEFDPIVQSVMLTAKKHERPPMQMSVQESLNDLIESEVGSFSSKASRKQAEEFSRDKDGSTEYVEVEKRYPRDEESPKYEQKEPTRTQKRTPKETHSVKRKGIFVDGEWKTFNVEWGNMDKNLAKTSYIDEDGVIQIVMNRDYSGLHAMMNRKPSQYFYIVHVVESIVEYVQKSNPGFFSSSDTSFVQEKDRITGNLVAKMRGVRLKNRKAKRGGGYTLRVMLEGKMVEEISAKTIQETYKKASHICGMPTATINSLVRDKRTSRQGYSFVLI